MLSRVVFSFSSRKRNLARIRAYMRGYRLLQKLDKLKLIADIKDQISKTPIKMSDMRFSALIFGTQRTRAELITRQFLLERLVNLDFNKAVLIAVANANKEIRYPLPREWRLILESNGIRAKTWLNSFLWLKYVVLTFLNGLLKAIMIFLMSLKSRGSQRAHPQAPYVYFEGLSKSNLPLAPANSNESRDIISWYISNENKNKTANTICHNVRGSRKMKVGGVEIKEVASAIPNLQSISKLVSFLFWSFKAFFFCLYCIFQSDFAHALLIGESAKYKQAKLCNGQWLALKYFFHNSGHLYKPLWTYATEDRGASTVLYFYSTNIESFKTKHGYFQENMWNVISWREFFVWDRYQASFIERMTGRKEGIRIVGPISFSDAEYDQKLSSDKIKVAVFDVQPMRESFYAYLGLFSEYYKPHNSNAFIEDIAIKGNEMNFQVNHKLKRDVKKLMHSSFYFKINELTSKGLLESIDPNVSAYHIIEQVDVVISMPFTSTAIVAKEMGKPSVYYDPHGEVYSDDRAAHGIPIVRGKRELTEWLFSTSKQIEN